MSEKLNISAPWVTFAHEIEALFGEDPEINFQYNEVENVVKLYVNNADKADAISKLIPTEKAFGNVTLKIFVIPANLLADDKEALFRKAFKGNPILSYIYTTCGFMRINATYIVFKNKAVQFFNDNLQDINGNQTTLYQDIAKDVFEQESGVFFCTDVEGNPGKPVKE